jgi:hypothetical protein
MTVAEKKAERLQVRSDLLAGKKPKRLLMNPGFSMEGQCGLAGVSILEAQFDTALLEKIFEKTSEMFVCDCLPGRNLRFAWVFQLLGAKNWIIGSTGMIQHPEIETMHEDEYDEFIAHPYDTIIKKFLPRVCTAVNTGDPMKDMLGLARAKMAYDSITAAQNAAAAKVSAKYGYVPAFTTNQKNTAPFDFLADQLRGFKQISMDVRRHPDKVKAACEAITPMMVKMATPQVIRPGLITFVPLHLGPFLNDKAFKELWWPTFEDMVVQLDKKGIACSLFVEQDWTRRAGEYLARLPKSTVMYMEAGDPEVFAKTVGKDHVFGGFFDPTITLGRSKEECIDAVKRLCDTCMSQSDHFYFTFDRSVIDAKSIDIPKLQAVLQYVSEINY